MKKGGILLVALLALFGVVVGLWKAANLKWNVYHHSTPCEPQKTWELIEGKTEEEVIKMATSGQLPLTILNATELAEVTQKYEIFSQDPKFMRPSNPIFDIYEGLTQQHRNFFNLLIAATIKNRSLFNGYFTPGVYNLSFAIPVEILYDTAYLNHRMPGYVLSFMPHLPAGVPGRPSPTLIPNRAGLNPREMPTLNIQTFRNHITLRDVNCSKEELTRARGHLSAVLRPAKWVVNVVDEAIFRMYQLNVKTATVPRDTCSGGLNLKYVCLHLRTEKDFKDFYTRKGKFTPAEAIMTRIVQHINNSNNSAFDLNVPFFIAGGHSEATIEALRAYIPLAYNKEMILPPVHPFRASTGYPRTLPALFDQEMCSRSYVFIGSRFSMWSNYVYEAFKQRGNVSQTFQYNGPNLEPFRSLRPSIYD